MNKIKLERFGKYQLISGLIAGFIATVLTLFSFALGGSCQGIGCTLALAGGALSLFFFVLSLMIIPGIGLMKRKVWAIWFNGVLLIVVLGFVWAGFRIKGDIDRQAERSRRIACEQKLIAGTLSEGEKAICFPGQTQELQLYETRNFKKKLHDSRVREIYSERPEGWGK